MNIGSALEVYKAITTKKRILKVKETTSILAVCVTITEVGINDFKVRADDTGTKIYLTCTEAQWTLLKDLLDRINSNDMMQETFEEMGKLIS